MTPSTSPPSPQALLTHLYWAGVGAAAPGPALAAALAARAGEPRRRVHILALGKAAYPMAIAAVAALAERDQEPAGGLVVTPEPVTSLHPRLPVVVGNHPEPGAGSLRAADLLGEASARIRPDEEAWVLLSGGTTSLIGAPVRGVSLKELTELYRLLLGSGLDISAMNRIRKRFIRWGAGRLATALAPVHVKNFTISDVIGDDLASIGSGPCVPDSSTAAEVRTSLTAAGLWEKVPAAMRDILLATEGGQAPETPKPHDPAFSTTETVLLASNRLVLEAACRRAADLGMKAVVLDSALAGEASLAGQRIASSLLNYDATNLPGAQGAAHKNTVLVWGGETTVTLEPGAGLGGRSQELALAAAERLGTGGRGDGGRVGLLAAGTDGRDGPTDAAGGFAEPTTWAAIQAAGRDPARDLRTHNAYAALEAAGALFKTGMTGTNVMDVVIGLIQY